MTLLDLLYIPLAVVTAPAWAGKRRRGWRERFGHVQPLGPKDKPRVLLHAVSVGEVSALRSLVPLLTAHAEVVVSATTDTGLARAAELFGATCAVRRYPIDFSWSVRRFLDRVRPDVVGLVELEVWPQFVAECATRGVPLAVINGRLSERSHRGYARVRRFFGKRLRMLTHIAVQDEAYAARFLDLGAPPDRVSITGSMKWDAAKIESGPVQGAPDLAAELGVDPSRPLIVAGSTGPGEEALLHRACPRGAQLLCAPRKPDRFDEAAAAMPGCVRRTARTPAPTGAARFLLDTIGELRKAYSLADVVVVGRSFADLYGSDPVEPIALGKATVIGPAVKDFEATVRAFDAGGGIARADRETLGPVLAALLASPEKRASLASAGLTVIRANRGASERHANLLLGLLPGRVGGPTMEPKEGVPAPARGT